MNVQVDTTGLAPGVDVLRVAVSGHGVPVDGVAVDGSATQMQHFTVVR